VNQCLVEIRNPNPGVPIARVRGECASISLWT
jgi:hypothetical protein